MYFSWMRIWKPIRGHRNQCVSPTGWKNKEERANVRDTDALSSFITAVGN